MDLDEVVSYRGAVSSLQEQASNASPVPTVTVDFDLCRLADQTMVPSAPIEPSYHIPEEEIALGTQDLSQIWHALCLHGHKKSYSDHVEKRLLVEQ